MYEYVNDKVKHGKIDGKWIFFNKGKIYDEREYQYAISHSASEEDFVLKGEKPVIKQEIKEEAKEEIKEVKPKKVNAKASKR